MDLRQMKYFAAVVRHRSFTQAAQKLYVAQPALGLQIRKLEDELGVQLLVRNTRGVEPTDAGFALMERVERILADVELTRKALQDYAGPLRGRISLGLTPTVSSLIAVPLLERCRTEMPNVSINLVEDLGSVLTEMLLDERLDLAVAFSVPPTLGLTTKALLEDSAYFISERAGAIADERPMDFEELAQHRLILPSMPNRLRQFLEEQAKASKIELKVALEVQSPATIIKLVERGFGPTVLSAAAIHAQLEDSQLQARQIQNPQIRYSLCLVRSDTSPVSKAELAVQDAISQLVQKYMPAHERP